MVNDRGASASAETPLLSIRGLRKQFGAHVAVSSVDIDLRPGEFVGLMGPNGAGKSTLIKMLSGTYEPDAGTIEFLGESVSSLAGRPEIGFVHQDLGLVDALSVLDNLRLGAVPLRRFGPLLNRSAERRAAAVALDKVGLDVDLDAPVASLSGGQKALLAVSRVLAQGARLLIIDEATSNLPPRESAWFVETLRQSIVEDGTCVVMVSHKLSELVAAAERVVLLIDGRKVADRAVTRGDERDIAGLLAAHDQEAVKGVHRRDAAAAPGEPVLTMDGVMAGGFGPYSLEVRAGEVVGLTGLVGSGLHDVGLLAAGAKRAESGSVRLTPGARRALVAPERERSGSIMSLSLQWNATLSALGRWRGFARLLRLTREQTDTAALFTRLNVVPDDPARVMGSLSGGNQQKVLFARALLCEPDLFVLCEPTRGVDVRTRYELYDLIARLRDEGRAVLVVSSDSEDLFAVCDRIDVVTATGIHRLGAPETLTQEQLMEVL